MKDFMQEAVDRLKAMSPEEFLEVAIKLGLLEEVTDRDEDDEQS